MMSRTIERITRFIKQISPPGRLVTIKFYKDGSGVIEDRSEDGQHEPRVVATFDHPDDLKDII